MEFFGLLDELDAELCGKKGLFNKKVDLEKCVALFQALKDCAYREFSDAKALVKKRQTVLDNADSVAKNIIKEAEERAAHMSGNSEVKRLAERESKVIVDRTYRQCELLVQKTKEHLDAVFCDTEAFFESTLEMIHKNRDELRNASIGREKN